MDARTLKRLLHDPETWLECPLSWDAAVVLAREACGFRPADRPGWLGGRRAERLVNVAARVLLNDAALGRVAAGSWLGLLDYWCACFLAPWPYDGRRAAASPLTLPASFGAGATLRLSAEQTARLPLPYQADSLVLRSAGEVADGSSQEREVLPKLAGALAWEPPDGGPDRRLLADRLPAEEYRAARASPLWRQLTRDQGPHPFEDRRLIDRAKVAADDADATGDATDMRTSVGASVHALLWSEWTAPTTRAERHAIAALPAPEQPTAELALRKKIRDRITKRLRKLGVPVHVPPGWWKGPPP